MGGKTPMGTVDAVYLNFMSIRDDGNVSWRVNLCGFYSSNGGE